MDDSLSLRAGSTAKVRDKDASTDIYLPRERYTFEIKYSFFGVAKRRYKVSTVKS
jgi:hypothetical protein